MTDVSLRCRENNAVPSQSKWSARFVRSVSSLFDWIRKMSSPGIYSAAQEVPRSECQDVPSQVPKQVEKNVCKDIPRQVRLVNQSISPYLIRASAWYFISCISPDIINKVVTLYLHH